MFSERMYVEECGTIRAATCLRTYIPRASGIFVDGREAEKRGYHSPPTVIWSRGGGQNGHVLARGGERSAGFPAYSSEGLSVCLGEAPEKPGVKSRAGDSLRNTRNACWRRRRLRNRYRSPGPGKRRDNASSFSRKSIFSLFSAGNEWRWRWKTPWKNARGALDKFFFFSHESLRGASPREYASSFFYFLFFFFREAPLPRARSISPAEFRHVNGRKTGLSPAPVLNREKHEVLNIFRAIVSRSHGDNSGQSATFRYGRIARTEYKERVNDLRTEYMSPELNVNANVLLLLL